MIVRCWSYFVSLFHQDVDECKDGSNACHINSNCNDTVGSYTCECRIGYSGDGYTCRGKDILNLVLGKGNIQNFDTSLLS